MLVDLKNILHLIKLMHLLCQYKIVQLGNGQLMSDSTSHELDHFMKGLRKRNPGEPEFHQAVHEVVETLIPFVLDNRVYRDAQILERMTEPDRVVIFRVCWEDDAGNIRTNRAWRVQFNNSIGPYKGGIRFHPDVTLSASNF